MKFAVMADVHGNLPALRAALGEVRRLGYKRVYHLGDAIGIGPFPAECLALMLEQPNFRFVMGNHDAYFAFDLPSPRPLWMSREEYTHHQWVRAQLDDAARAAVRGWPYLIEDDLNGVGVSLLHYALTEDGCDFAPIVNQPTPDKLDRLFAAVRGQIVFYGHHHPTSDLTGRARYVNPSALGCGPEPLARFVGVECGPRGRFTIHHHAVPYCQEEVFKAFERRQVPARKEIYRAFFGGVN